MDADGLALMLIVGVIGLALLLVAIVIEAIKVRAMRRQQRRREAYSHYCDLVDQQATKLADRFKSAA
jgi:hypothetical protein